MEEELEATVVEMEAKEVVSPGEEGAKTLMVVVGVVAVPWAMKTLGQNAALEFPVFAKVE